MDDSTASSRKADVRLAKSHSVISNYEHPATDLWGETMAVVNDNGQLNYINLRGNRRLDHPDQIRAAILFPSQNQTILVR